MFFNGVPFHSVLPDTRRYPCFGWGATLPGIEDGEGLRTASMCAARIREDLPDLVDAGEKLIQGRVSFEDALQDYFPRLVAAYGGDASKVFTFDGIHEEFLS